MTTLADDPAYTLIFDGGTRTSRGYRFHYLVKAVGVGMFRIETEAATRELAELYISGLIEREGFSECRRRAHELVKKNGLSARWLRVAAPDYGRNR